jgi:putative ABC transport system substrate-binding protein
MKRRDFIKLIGGAAAAWPLAARAEQSPLPVIGYLATRSPGEDLHLLAAFRQGLKEAGYIEGQNVAVEYRYAANHYERLPGLAGDLVRRQVTVIFAGGGIPAATAAKEASSTIPIVIAIGGDPVQLGLIASLNRPGGNITGVNLLNNELAPKLVQLLQELLPKATEIGFLINPNNPVTESLASEVTAAGHTIGQRMHLVTATTETDLALVFETIARLRVDALLVQGDPFLNNRRDQLVALAARHAVPTIYPFREYVAAGGLMSYGSDLADALRMAGVYAGPSAKARSPQTCRFSKW